MVSEGGKEMIKRGWDELGGGERLFDQLFVVLIK